MVRAARPRRAGAAPLEVWEGGRPIAVLGIQPRRPATGKLMAVASSQGNRPDCRDLRQAGYRRRERLPYEAGGESSGEEVRSPGSAVRAADASRRALGGFAARGGDVDGPASDRITEPRGPIPSLPG